jgi:hypothetical protein
MLTPLIRELTLILSEVNNCHSGNHVENSAKLKFLLRSEHG